MAEARTPRQKGLGKAGGAGATNAVLTGANAVVTGADAVLTGARSFGTYTWTRLRHGELGQMPALVGLAAIWIYFEYKQPTFLSARNLSNLVLQIGVTGTIATGIVLVLLLSEIDLSVGSVSILCSAILANLMVNQGWPWYWGLVMMLVGGAAVGAFQGYWFAVIGVPSFVVTLAGLLGWQGVQQYVLGSTGTINVFDPHIDAIATTTLPKMVGWILAIVVAGMFAVTQVEQQIRRRRAGLPSKPLVVIGVRTAFVAVLSLLTVAILNGNLDHVWVFGEAFYINPGVPTVGVILLGLVVFFAWLTTRTQFGRYIYAVGGNAEAARRAGVNITAIRITVFSLCALLAAVAGLIQTSRLTAASQAIAPGQVTLEAIAAAVIGGASLFGGRGTVWAALLGALVIGSVSNGLDLDGQQPYMKLIVEGAILLLFVTIDALARRGRAAAGT
jgi:D-xylose transport system permease protein